MAGIRSGHIILTALLLSGSVAVAQQAQNAARALGLKVSTSFIALPLLAGPADIEL